MQVKDKDGVIKNRYVPPEFRKALEKFDLNQKYLNRVFNRKNLMLRIVEIVVAAFLSVALHSLAYNAGDKYDNMDLSQHESEIHFRMKNKLQMYDENELDFLNYFFRKMFYHFMSVPG